MTELKSGVEGVATLSKVVSTDLGLVPDGSVGHGQRHPRAEGFHRTSAVPLTMVPRPNEPASLGSAQDITTSSEPDAVYNYQPDTAPPVPNIADRFADLLKPLSRRRRNALIAQLSRGYYDGWHPTRAEVAALVAEELRRSP